MWLKDKTKDNVSALKYSQELIQALNYSHIMLIDDIDTGLHYTKQESIWEFLITSAIKLDSQVFATTHNLEMIAAFEKASRKLNASDNCCYIKLSQHPKTKVPIFISFEMETLGYALAYEKGIGLRGE